MRLIDADALKKKATMRANCIRPMVTEYRMCVITRDIDDAQTIEAEPVKHGKWIYEVHKENSNYGWNVTTYCSECCDNIKEIWRGLFPNVPDWLARDVALQSAKSVKLDNYCPNCGAKMDLEG
jgi:hypothetical protein